MRRLAEASLALGLALFLVFAASAPAAAQTATAVPAQDCARCHATSGWERPRAAVKGFPHARTGFPLRGAHAALACDTCHDGRATTRGRDSCAACHADPHRGEQGLDCDRCHDERSFRASEGVRKHRRTRFPLTGSHALAECGACHLDVAAGRFAGVPTSCVACHLRDYNATANPPHASSGFSTSCEECHRPTVWSTARVVHDRFFPLRGAHAAAACAECHANGRFAGTPTDCYSCHAKDYAGTTNPGHAQAGFPTTCGDCHNSAAWQPATFNHASVFPLTGAHAAVSCAQCHPNNRFAGTPTDCYSCHTKDYAGTTSPAHAAAGFPTTCATCHSTSVWQPSTFNHPSVFPLTGAHASVSCAQCHANNRFAGTPTDCYACHAADYAGTNNPVHSAAGFPTTCATCHSTASWQGATFNHDSFFPLSSGSHARFATSCSSCHVNPSNFAVFTCTGCHAKPDMDSHHQGVRGYVYADASCYSCHPQGRSP